MPSLNTLLITVSPDVALHAESCGVDSIFVDMESRGKAERQGHLDTHRAEHTLDDVARLAPLLTRSELLVRLNPIWEGTAGEVEGAVVAGADRLMLPMFRTPDDVEVFKNIVAGRVPVTLLVETAAALSRLPSILPLLSSGDRVHFGLNDLALDMKLSFLFEVLGGRLLDGPSALCREAGVPFGIGGVGRIGHGNLPAEWIVGEHVRLGSEWVILSRAFHNGIKTLQDLERDIDLRAEIEALRRCCEEFSKATAAELSANHLRLARKAAELGGMSQ
ncbi:aldolase/citrate lyase family protein [Parvibaculum sp.]|uniref:aldolase/citrate lyase family protein n=1 Tax=Parvibaculum sp. TaxID=2024848 RepID=UPI0039199494